MICDPFGGIFLVGPRPRTHMLGEMWWPDRYREDSRSLCGASFPHIPYQYHPIPTLNRWYRFIVSIASGCTSLFHLQTQAINVAMSQDIMDSTHRLSQAKLRKGQTSWSLPSCSSGTGKITNVFRNVMWWCWQADSNGRLIQIIKKGIVDSEVQSFSSDAVLADQTAPESSQAVPTIIYRALCSASLVLENKKELLSNLRIISPSVTMVMSCSAVPAPKARW